MQNEFWKNRKVCVTGGEGFLGKHLVKKLKEKEAIVFIPRIEEYDLRKMEDCIKVTEGQEIVIHLAGVLGGIEFNKEKPGQIYFDNMSMNISMMEAARQRNAKKFVGISSVSAYPQNAKMPLKEESLFDGSPEPVKAAYSFSKRMLIVQTQAYKKQYNFNAITLIFSNIYGPGDNFDEKTAHVIPSLIKKYFQNDVVKVSGNPDSSRSFLYVEDAADAIILATEKYNSSEPLNISDSEEIKIRELVDLIGRYTNFEGKVEWSDNSSICSRKSIDTIKARNTLGFKARISTKEGIKKTINWYKNNF